MKAESLIKDQKYTIEQIYNDIKEANERGDFKFFIPHQTYITEQTKIELINNGFKVYFGSWDNIMTNCLIIEW